jgi:Fe-S-cluster containining protein
MHDELRRAVMNASRRPEVRAAVSDIYDALQAAIDLRRPLCTTSGRCCNFESYGHRLYVTTMELAAFDGQLESAQAQSSQQEPIASPAKNSLPLLTTTSNKPPTTNSSCPFQIDRLCSVHGIRPFGCRVFFCDQTATDWQHEQYERFHAQLRRLHEELDVPYFYVEWRFALDILTSSDLRSHGYE